MGCCSSKDAFDTEYLLTKPTKVDDLTYIAIGDIEGNINKLNPIYKLIKSKQKLKFIFLGDLFDDLSYKSRESQKNWKCISMLSEFFYEANKYSFKSDVTNECIDNGSEYQIISLPSAFKNIKFNFTKFNEIESQVIFIAGNSECDALSDFKLPFEYSKGKYIFKNEKAKYDKKVTFDEMVLLYKYFMSCYGIIELESIQSNTYGNYYNNYYNAIYFRHSPSLLKIPENVLVQNSKEPHDERKKFVFITGHTKNFDISVTSDPDAPAYVIDTSTKKYKNQIGLAKISICENCGYSVKLEYYPINHIEL